MPSSSSLPPRARRIKALFLATFAVLGALLVASCLTPDFNFDEPSAGDGDIGEGGSGNMSSGGTGGGSLADHCENRTKDRDETDTDCGGRDCGPCELGRTCQIASDCVNDSCTAGKCQMPTCTDKEKNLNETDVDCGGDGCPPCADDETCLKSSDCESRSCSGGTCKTATCTDRIKNGNESDLDCGGDCEPCEAGDACVIDEDCIQPPAEDPSTTECQDAVCTVVCGDARLADCNSDATDGCEVDTFTDVDHCGACDIFCNPPHATAGVCIGGACEIDFASGGCDAPYLDCNGEHDDGCEVNKNSNAAHCGDCNAACSDENGSPSCSEGACLIECEDGFTDCDEDARNTGCEINTDVNAQMCGASCETCPAGTSTQSPHCVAGACGLTDCDPGKGDCDGDGICDDVLNTTTNCGSCGNACSVSNAATSCVDPGSGTYGCTITSCVDTANTDYENCDAAYATGCETNVLVSATHCGACNTSGGENCTALKNNAALHIASILCDTGSCTISSCSLGYADCDGDATNGCEVNTNTDDVRCGGCLSTDIKAGSGESCGTKWANSTGNCVTGACEFTGCVNSNWGNCKNGLTDGCETDLRVDEGHCGACNAACLIDTYTSTNTCSAKQCTATCTSNGAHCDADQWNGCENIASDADNCGTCDNVCGGDAGTDVSTASCSSKSCSVTCTNNKCPDSTSEKACTLSLGTTANCSFCGEVCSGDTNICTATGCKDHLPINVVATANFTATSPTASTTYTLSSAASSTRGLILAVAIARNPSTSITAKVTWNGGASESLMTQAHIQSMSQADAAIFYLQEADLPAAGTQLTLQTFNADGWGGLVGSIIEVNNLYQAGDPVTEAGGTENPTDCGINTIITRSASVTYADSLIVAVAMGQGNDGTGTPSGLTEVFDEFSLNQTHGMTGYKNGATANATVGWTSMTGCWDTVLATATFRPWKP